jgi:hypothetical protein
MPDKLLRRTGLIPSTRQQLAKARYAFRSLGGLDPPPAAVYNGAGVKFWDMGGNGPAFPTDLSYTGQPVGDCVACMIANGKKALTTSNGAPEIDIPAVNTVSWYFGQTGGQDIGLNIPDAMTAFQTTGMADASGKIRIGGPNAVIDWSNETELRQAIALFKIVALGVAADQLQQAAGETSGWTLTGAQHDPNLDHCVFLLGYGAPSYLAGQLGVPMPGGLNPSGIYYALYTWATVGIVDFSSVRAITGEAHIFETDPDRGDAAAWDTLAANDYALLTGQTPPNPPGPPGPPDPTSAPTLAQVQAVIDPPLEGLIADCNHVFLGNIRNDAIRRKTAIDAGLQQLWK